MKAIILKEIRECSVVALLMLVALGSILACIIRYSANDATPLVSGTFRIATGFGYPVMGVWLGLTQIMADRRRGRWDFVTHRPLSRTRIFFAKIIAGSAIYLLVGIIPHLCAALWIAIPGHFASPFYWHMIFPRLSDLFSGLVWYFAGFLVGGRRARWIGSRLMPLGFAFFTSLAGQVFAMNLLQACGLFTAALLILIPAAWGAFVFGGEYEPQPLFVRFFQGASVGTGLVLIVMMVAGLIVATLSVAFPETVIWSPSYRVDDNGQIIRSSYGPHGEEQLMDLDGKPLSESQARQVNNRSAFAAYLSLRESDSPDLPWPTRVSEFGFQNGDIYARQLSRAGDRSDWFYVPNREAIEVYDNYSRRYIGSPGPEGFISAPSSPGKFPQPMRYFTTGTIAGSNAAYIFIPEDREVRKIFTTTDDDPIIAVTQMSYSDTFSTRDPGPHIFGTIVVTHSAIHILRGGQKEFRIPLEHPYPPYFSLEIYRVSGSRFVFQYAGAELPDGSRQGDWFVQTDDRGKILSRRQMPAWSDQSEDWPNRVMGIVAIPPVLAFTNSDVGRSRVIDAGLALVSLASAIATFMLLGLYTPRPGMKIIWIIVAAAMGISGILLLLSMRQRVGSVKCPACGKPRLVTQEHCRHCQALFQPPAMLGIEIFEPV